MSKTDLTDVSVSPPLDLTVENFNFAANLQYTGSEKLEWFK
jgi:hypothetical protein